MTACDGTTSSADEPKDDPATTALRCVACGYNLHGLGDDPRCPECGLLNAPIEYRRQVWKLVDSGKWFLSGAFTPFRKRLPGWWWALDRDGDVRRALRFAAIQIAASAVLIIVFATAGDSLRVTVTTTWTLRNPPNDPLGQVVHSLIESVQTFGLGGESSGPQVFSEATETLIMRYSARSIYGWSEDSASFLFSPSIPHVRPLLTFLALLVLIWATPSFAGLCTQLRRGMSKVARPPRTILNACLYEMHRLPYAAVPLAAGMVADPLMRYVLLPNPFNMYHQIVPAFFIGVTFYAALGWVGPLRSDYTRQLVRSRFHAARILVMYAILFPPLLMAFLMLLPFVWM